MANEKVGAVLVVGGGVAGIQAALDLADSGFRVYMIDKKPAIGGVMSQLDKTFPTNDCSMCILAPKLVAAGRHPNITLITNAEIVGLSGEAGNFEVKILRKARYIDEEKCNGCGVCAQKCPVEAIDEYNQGLSERSAVYVLYPQAVPLKYMIDREKCIGCGTCKEVCKANAINYEEQDSIVTLKVGSIILAPGFESFDARLKSEYGYGRYPNVVTSIEFERILSASGPYSGMVLRPSDGEIPRKVAFIQCVGSRDVQVGNNYCSAACCMYAIKEAVIAKEHQSGLDCTIFFMDIRAYGKDFELYYL
ncbi:heterodisulfide reductase, partial [Candidatus Bathyarchaeota archaeon]